MPQKEILQKQIMYSTNLLTAPALQPPLRLSGSLSQLLLAFRVSRRSIEIRFFLLATFLTKITKTYRRQEMATGNERAKRNGSLILDLVLGVFILAPLGILGYSVFFGDQAMLDKVEFYFEQLKKIPEAYLWLIFIVVGGNYGISVTNLLTKKKFK